MFSVVRIHKNQFHFKQTDLPTESDGNTWISNNVTECIDEHWVIKTSDLLKLSTGQFNSAVVNNFYK